MDPVVISLVSACTALVASIAGPVVTLLVARRQIKANVLSANRQKWIEALREAIAELLSLLVAALVVKSQWKERWDSGRGALHEDRALLDKLQRMVLTQSKVRLLTNPTEPDHQKLVATIEAALLRLRAEGTDNAATEADILRITELAQSILKREWLRVKHGT
jgi:hypothetical protein